MSQIENQIEYLRTLQESYNVIAQEYSQEKEAIIQELQAAGVEIADDASLHDIAQAMPQFTRLIMGDTQFADDSGIYTLGDAILSTLTIPDTKIKKLHSNYMVNIPNNFLKGDTSLEEVELNGVENIGESAFRDCLNCKVAIFKNCTSIGLYTLKGNPLLRVVIAPKIYFDWHDTGMLPSGISLALLECAGTYGGPDGYYHGITAKHYWKYSIGDAMTGDLARNWISGYDARFMTIQKASVSINFSSYWKGFTATGEPYETDEFCDPDEPHFYNLGEQVLWYFKNHFLYNGIDGEPGFEDMTGQTSPTLTLPAGVRDLVMADAEVAEYFSSRNWTVA